MHFKREKLEGRNFKGSRKRTSEMQLLSEEFSLSQKSFWVWRKCDRYSAEGRNRIGTDREREKGKEREYATEDLACV